MDLPVNLMSALRYEGIPSWTAHEVRLQRWDFSRPPRHVHVVPSLSMGGAERIVADLSASFAECGIEAEIAVMRDAAAEHSIVQPGVGVHRLGTLSWPERIAYVSGIVKASRLPAYCHLTSEDELRRLWAFGIDTVPVVHNVAAGWRQSTDIWQGNERVPFVVACGDVVAQDLKSAGLTKPVRVFRHVVRQPAAMADEARRLLRAEFGADATTLLIGMTGRFAVQKRYVHAVRLLRELRSRDIDARLVIVGPALGDESTRCRRAVLDEATRLGVKDFMILAGARPNAGELVGAYDVFLNTSLWEGVSISTMEAVAAGVPVVSADVGGQREAVCPQDILLPTQADEREWADAVMQVASSTRTVVADTTVARHATASFWPWSLILGPQATLSRNQQSCDVVFVTGNLDVGGAQRSLCNLVEELAPRGVNAVVAVAGPVGVPGFMEGALAAGVEFIDVSGIQGSKGALRGRMGRILSLLQARSPKTVCFWNLDAATKMAVAKVLAGGPIRVVDVSPGPMLHKELDAEHALANLLSSGSDSYVAGLDLLVSKYEGGGPCTGRSQPLGYAVIPNGVPEPKGALTPGDGPMPPLGSDPSLSVVTVGRLTAAKRPELLPLVARALARRVPGATLTVVGGTHGTDRDGAWSAMVASCGGVLPENLHVFGPDDRATSFLPRFACFYMVSTDQGCPNASLEAMMSGLPIVANPDGGTAEQVRDGVNGYLVADTGNPADYADRLADALASVLLDKDRARSFGRTGQRIARERFSMAMMADRYIDALFPQQES